jgi:hypothetical protein
VNIAAVALAHKTVRTVWAVSVLNVLNSQPLLQHDSDASGSTLQYAYTFRPRTVALTGTERF